MIKRSDKRGEEGSSIGFFISIALGVALLVFAIVWMSGGFDTLNLGNKIDIDNSVAEQTCSLYASQGSSSYCNSKLFTKQDDSYINCVYAVKELGVKIGDNSPVDCGASGSAEKEICTKLALDEDKFNPSKILVNTKPCSDWFGGICKPKDNTASDSDCMIFINKVGCEAKANCKWNSA